MTRPEPFSCHWLLLVLFLITPLRADITLDLPLEGYYRPGRYLPVRYSASSAAALTISGPGVLPTRIDLSSGPARGIAPVLPLESALRQLHAQVDGQPPSPIATTLRALSPDQALIGFTGPDPSALGQLFPDKTLIPIRLTPADLLAASPVAWETLDALVLDAATAVQLKQETLAALAASGVILAAQADAAPDSQWPWRQVGPYWILHYQPAGPMISTAYPILFDPVQGWQADWPVAFRHRVLLYALIFSILMLGLVVIRPRFTPVLAVLLSAATVVSLALWWRGRAAVLQREGDIVILSNRLRQTDTWTYIASATPASASLPCSAAMRPLFEQPADRQTTGLLLRCASDGQPLSFTWRCVPGVKLAFLSRSITPWTAGPGALEPAEGNPLALLARRVYLAPGSRILGQFPADPSLQSDAIHRWPTLVIEQKNQ
jgi:hypothetical protein